MFYIFRNDENITLLKTYINVIKESETLKIYTIGTYFFQLKLSLH